MADDIQLAPALEQFARDCVASGRYGSVTEVVEAALTLLQETEEERARFVEMLEQAEEEADRIGVHTVEEVLTGMGYPPRSPR